MFVRDFLFSFMQLTPDEEQRRKLRRERNKVAASKCRMKRKEHVTTLRKVRRWRKRRPPGGTPLYGLDRYVQPQRVGFFSRFGHK